MAASLLGTGYRVQDEHAALVEPEPFAVDSSIVERGVLAHTTQNLLGAMPPRFWVNPTLPRDPSTKFNVRLSISWPPFSDRAMEVDPY